MLNWLRNITRRLRKVAGDFLAGIALKAEADRLLKQGNQQYAISQFREALQSYEEALTIYRQIGYRQGEANSLGNLGIAYDSLGQFHRAIAFHEQSLEIQREIGNRQGEANSLGNLGNTYHSLGQYQRAIAFHEQDLEITRKIRNRLGEAASLCNLGSAYHSLGQYQRAIAFHEQDLEITREINDRLGEANSLCGLGIAYNSLGQYQKAIEFHEQYLKIQREINDRLGEANSLCGLGIAYNSLGQYQKAIEFYEQYLEISREIGYRLGESMALNNLGETLLKTNQLAEAETAVRASIEIHETLRSELVNNEHKASIFETQVSAYRLLQQVLIAQTRFDKALEISEMGRTRAFVELLQQTLLTNDVPTNDKTNKLSIPKIQQIARDRNSTIVEYSIVYPEIYIWIIQPNGNITHRAANLEPLNQQNQTLKQIILKTRISIGTVETDDEGNKIQLESQYKRDETGRFPYCKSSIKS